MTMTNTQKDLPKSDENDEHFVESVKKSTHVIEHELANLHHNASKIHDLKSLLKNSKHTKHQ